MIIPSSPTIRSSLIRIHKTLIRISDLCLYSSTEVSLSNLELATIALEDRRFFKHNGFDLRSLIRECFRAITFQRFGGASTIDIQLFRTISGRYERTIRRKVREIVGALALQRKCSKIQILRCYLDNAYFGTGLYGQEAASLSVFNKSASDLNVDEACYIASMLVYPKPSVASGNWETKIRRRSDYGRLLIRTRKERFK